MSTDGRAQLWIKMTVFLKLICRFKAIPLQISTDLFVKISKLILKFCMEFQATHHSQNYPGEKKRTK